MADVPQPTDSQPPLAHQKQTRNLDGVYLMLGVGGAASRIEAEWDSTVGGHVVVATVSEGHFLSLVGLDIGLSQYGDRQGGRVWLAPVVGTRRIGALVGLSAGLSVEWDRTVPPKLGAVASLWGFAGIVPYASIGSHERVGRFVELGVRLTLPALRLARSGLF